MPALIIGPEQIAKIAELRAFAAGNVRDPQASIAAGATDMAAYRDMMRMSSMELPVGYRATYTLELQPVGLCSHISVSVDRDRALPSTQAVEVILEAFGMRPIAASLKIWPEKIDSDTSAINILQSARAVF